MRFIVPLSMADFVSGPDLCPHAGPLPSAFSRLGKVRPASEWVGQFFGVWGLREEPVDIEKEQGGI